METFQTIGFFILAIVPLIIVHELGHFIAAKLTGTRTEIFSIGMGPRLCGWNKRDGFSWGVLPLSWQSHGVTDYRLSLLPIGGYVKIAGMIDEKLDISSFAAPPHPWEFRAKSTWQKTFMILGGILMNLLFAYFVFVWLATSSGKTELATRTIAYVAKNSPAEQFGFRTGDQLLGIDNTAISTYSEFLPKLAQRAYSNAITIKIQRNGADTALFLNGRQIRDALSQRPDMGIIPDGMRPFIIDVETLRPAGKAGLRSGDTILSADGISLASVEHLIELLQERKNTSTVFIIKRSDGVHRTVLTPDENGKIGVQVSNVVTGPLIHSSYSILEALDHGTRQIGVYTTMLVRSILLLITGEQSLKQSAGGPIMIARLADQTADLGAAAFFTFMATLSLTLAVMNILPIPALDGGHLVLIAIEGIIGRELSTKVKVAYQQIGIALIVALMVIVFYNDITR